MVVKFNRRDFIAAGSAAAVMPFCGRDAPAQNVWPSRNIRMVCSYPAGGQTDLLARAFGDYISKQVGQTVLVENRRARPVRSARRKSHVRRPMVTPSCARFRLPM